MSSSMTAEQVLSITKTLVSYFSYFTLILGLVGNCLNIILFTKLKALRDKTCGFYFLTESIVDLSQILFGVVSFIIETGFGINMSTNSTVWCKIKTTTIQSLHIVFLSTVCMVALDQFLATHHSINIRRISTKQFAHNLFFSTEFLMIIHLILSLIYYELKSPVYGCIIYNTNMAIYYNFFFYPVFNCLVPMSITIGFSLRAFHNVRYLVRRQIPLERRQLDHQVTAMTFARVIAFIICTLPYFIYRVYALQTMIKIEITTQYATIKVVEVVVSFLAYLNYVVRLFFVLLLRFFKDSFDLFSRLVFMYSSLYQHVFVVK